MITSFSLFLVSLLPEKLLSGFLAITSKERGMKLARKSIQINNTFDRILKPL
jgi:hypothetical protein